MKVADLFAELDIRPDKRSIGKADQMLGKIKNQLLGVASAAAVAFGVKDALEFSRAMRRLETAASGAMGTAKQLEQRILDVSDATGVTKEEIAAGSAAFISLTGDADAAKKSMELFGKVQVATGGSMEDISKTAAAMQQNLKIKPEQFEKAFSILISGGKKGAIELRDAAGVLSSLTPLMEQFKGGAGIEGLAELGASLQLSRQGFGSAKETATGLKALFGAFKQNAKKFEAAGIKIFDKDPKTGRKTLRNFTDIINEIGESKLALDPTLLTQAFGSKEAEAAFTQLVKNKGALEELTKATLKANDVEEDYNATQSARAFKVAKAWNKIKNTMSRVFLVIADGLGFLLEHFKEVALVAGALAAAFTVLKFAAIKAAVAALASWIAALLPFILLAALIAGIIYVIQALTGHFVDFSMVFDSIGEAAVETFAAIINWIDKTIGKAKELLDYLPGFLDDPTGKKFNTVGGKNAPRSVRSAQLLQSGDRIVREARQGNAPGATVGDTNITVNVPAGSDAGVVADAVRDEMDRHRDMLIRETVGATEN